MPPYPGQGDKPWGVALREYIDALPQEVKDDLATVAETGSYTDLTDKPSIPAKVSVRRDTPAAEWVINHNLGAFPDPVVILDDEPFRRVYTDVTYPSNMQIVLTFPSPVAGWVHLN